MGFGMEWRPIVFVNYLLVFRRGGGEYMSVRYYGKGAILAPRTAKKEEEFNQWGSSAG
jgi:hypothetical protein